MNRLIALANTMNEEGYNKNLVSAALMSASAVYATFVGAGNTGALEPSGVDKVVNLFRNNLEHIQNRKKEDLLAASTEQTETEQ